MDVVVLITEGNNPKQTLTNKLRISTLCGILHD